MTSAENLNSEEVTQFFFHIQNLQHDLIKSSLSLIVLNKDKIQIKK